PCLPRHGGGRSFDEAQRPDEPARESYARDGEVVLSPLGRGPIESVRRYPDFAHRVAFDSFSHSISVSTPPTVAAPSRPAFKGRRAGPSSQDVLSALEPALEPLRQVPGPVDRLGRRQQEIHQTMEIGDAYDLRQRGGHPLALLDLVQVAHVVVVPERQAEPGCSIAVGDECGRL